MSSSTQDTGNFSDEGNDTTLISAAADGLADRVQQLIAAKANLELQDDWGMTALSHAIENDHPHIVKLLADANVVLDNADGNNVPLICAAERGLLQIVEVLLAAKASVDIEDANGHTALWHAQNNGHTDIVDVLLASNASHSDCVTAAASDAKTFDVSTQLLPIPDKDDDVEDAEARDEMNLRAARSELLYDAACKRNVVVLKKLLSTNASLDWRNAYGHTPLIQAVIEKNTAAAELLLEHRADVDASGNENRTALIHAVIKKNTAAVQLLLERRAGVDVPDNENRTALIHAVINGDTDMFNTLIQAGATIDHEDMNGMTALKYAMRDGDVGRVQLLVDANAAIDAQSNQMLTQSNELLDAARTGDVALTHTLLAARVSPDVKCNGVSVLTIALTKRHYNVISALIEAKATIDPQQSCWNRALRSAAGRENYGAIHVLIDAKAAFDPTDNYWQRVLIKAAGGNGYKAVKSLINANVSLSAVNRTKETALMCAAAGEQFPTVQLLLENNALIDADNPVWQQQTMMRAIGNGKLKAVECMLNWNISPNVPEDENQKTPLVATQEDQFVTLRTLPDATMTPPVDAIEEDECQIRLPPPPDAPKTPLMHAIAMNQFEILQILLDAGARIEPENRAWAVVWREVAGSGTDWDQLEVRWHRHFLLNRHSSSNSELEAAKRMLDLRISTNIVDQQGCTPLMYAVKVDNFDFARLLMDANATVNPRQEYWAEALFRNMKRHWSQDDEILVSDPLRDVQFLLDTNVSPDVIDSDGRTPLMYASMMGADSIVRLLLAAVAQQQNEQSDML